MKVNHKIEFEYINKIQKIKNISTEKSYELLYMWVKQGEINKKVYLYLLAHIHNEVE